MKLTDKLKKYMASTPKGKKPHKSQESLYSQDFHEFLGGTPIETPYGSHMVIDTRYDLVCDHGEISLGRALDISPKTLEIMTGDPAFNTFDFKKVLFIDTETTGLAGGTGTLPFLIGLGHFADHEFHMRQYFLRDFDEEASALYSIKRQVEDFEGLVSFNGKVFDIPLLSTRLTLNRMGNPFQDLLHLDLLFPARRIYRERLKSVRLSSLETGLLNVRRVGDIPGYEIPSVYFDYLQDKNPGPMKPIFYHNRIDILTMVALATRLSQALDDPLCPQNCKREDYYCLGRVFADRGYLDKAEKCYKKALKIPQVRPKAYVELSLLYKRQGALEKAEKLWMEMVRGDIESPFALVELAKYYEHKLKDYDKALDFTEKAIDLKARKKVFSLRVSKEPKDELLKRWERIKRKQQRREKIS